MNSIISYLNPFNIYATARYYFAAAWDIVFEAPLIPVQTQSPIGERVHRISSHKLSYQKKPNQVPEKQYDSELKTVTQMLDTQGIIGYEGEIGFIYGALNPSQRRDDYLSRKSDKFITRSMKRVEEALRMWCDEVILLPEMYVCRNEAAQRILSLHRQPGAFLNLHGLNLTSLPQVIGQFSNVTNLDISNNQLTFIPEALFQLSELTYLDLSSNQLTSIPEGLFKLSKLTVLRLSNNQLCSISQNIANLSRLQIFRLGSNNLSSIPENIGSLKRLELLDLGNNQLTSLPDSLRNLVNLRYLCLARNHLTSIPNLSKCCGELHADFSNNPITQSHFIPPYNIRQSLNLSCAPKVARLCHQTAPLTGPKLTLLFTKLGADVTDVSLEIPGLEAKRLDEEVKQLINRVASAVSGIFRSIPEAILSHAEAEKDPLQFPNTKKIIHFAREQVYKVDAIVLPGGLDVEPEFYLKYSDCPAFLNGYERSMFEFAFLREADKQNKIGLGSCRGIQMMNVYFGGTLMEINKQMGWKFVEILEGPRKQQIDSLIQGRPIQAYSEHSQACKKVAPNFSVIMNGAEKVVKAILSEDGRFFCTQFHPELDNNEGLYSSAIILYQIPFETLKNKTEQKKLPSRL